MDIEDDAVGAGGNGRVAIHGTSLPQLIGQAVSHGSNDLAVAARLLRLHSTVIHDFEGAAGGEWSASTIGVTPTGGACRSPGSSYRNRS